MNGHSVPALLAKGDRVKVQLLSEGSNLVVYFSVTSYQKIVKSSKLSFFSKVVIMPS